MTGEVCGWTPRCAERAEYTVRSHTRPGLVLTFHVCDTHRRIALSQGYHLVPASADVPAPETGDLGPADEPDSR